MNDLDLIQNSKGMQFLVFNKSEFFNNAKIGNKLKDYEILMTLGDGTFGKIFKVRSKLNKKIYAMKMVDLKKTKEKDERLYELTLNEVTFLNELSNPHIIKYYNNFIEGDNLYIIVQYVSNGDIQEYIDARKEINRHFQEEELLNIFLQCMMALSYIHKKGVIHRDIKPKNILIDNNMKIKLGDFGIAALIFEKNKKDNIYLNAEYNIEENEYLFYNQTIVGTMNYMAKEMIEKAEYDQKCDVYSMGVTFFEMMYFHSPKINSVNDKNIKYSKEIIDILTLMLQEDKDKRATSSVIYEKIFNEYSKRIRNSSIDSIITSLGSLGTLTDELFKINKEIIKTLPITKAYIECINMIGNQDIQKWNECIINIRKILGTANLKLEGTKEIDPRFVFAFIIEQIHKELNKEELQAQNYELGSHLLISGKENSKTDENEMKIRFINNFHKENNSIIINNFSGLMKITKNCNICNINTYSFNYYFFATFNLKKIINDKNITLLDLEKNFIIEDTDISTTFFCSKCFQKTSHKIYKQFYSFPNALVISIYRGVYFECKAKIKIKNILELKDFNENKTKKYQLVSIIKRIIKNNEECFISNYYYKGLWLNNESNEKDKILKNPSESNDDKNDEGDIIMLFYKLIN